MNLSLSLLIYGIYDPHGVEVALGGEPQEGAPAVSALVPAELLVICV